MSYVTTLFSCLVPLHPGPYRPVQITLLLVSILIIVTCPAGATPVPQTTVAFGDPTQTTQVPSPTGTATASGAFLANDFTLTQKQAVFWTSIAIAVLVSFIQGAITVFIDICEAEGFWTLRFRVAMYEHIWWTGIAVSLAASLGSMVVSFLAGNTGESLGIITLATASSLIVFRYAWPAWRNRHYCLNRWMAWTGPSRTGIESKLVCYIGGPQDWRALDTRLTVSRPHPVERRLWLFRDRHQSQLIISDPTDLLREALKLDSSNENCSTNEASPSPVIEKRSQRGLESNTNPQAFGPSSVFSFISDRSPVESSERSDALESKKPPDGVYAPIVPDQSVSLLWGIKLGFSPRASRGILAIPSRLLTSHPRSEGDHDGKALCLAHGILARNKGLAPSSFIFRKPALDMKKLEEKSFQWPRPSKVLRSYYKKEMKDMYGALGDGYVACATELALLLADTHPNVVTDWLRANLEHQDIQLNRQIAELGASEDELKLLYQLSYAVMLVSLSSYRSAHTGGCDLRPELSVFRAYLLHVEGKEESELPSWMNDDQLKSRLTDEREGVDPRSDLDALIEAVLPSPLRAKEQEEEEEEESIKPDTGIQVEGST
ncbi:hypothetical protein K435DRAFT_859018 [Dendrothele bispora CBS 962.96]|uniref:Transmembrane protein n=1 Tax=Dendrothele bispora (strain CBS 962.96) TaxID=1314807 RepID=A0A4S8M1H1_DENBC|nr:hypothetical protein K435DRAFT_859018 [Dendrothele bispora CBS 962.96]